MEKRKDDVPFIAYESALVRMERMSARLWIMLIIAITMLVMTNLAWIFYERQFETTSATYTQEVDSGDGGDAIINDGVHVDGKSETDGNY